MQARQRKPQQNSCRCAGNEKFFSTIVSHKKIQFSFLLLRLAIENYHVCILPNRFHKAYSDSRTQNLSPGVTKWKMTKWLTQFWHRKSHRPWVQWIAGISNGAHLELIEAAFQLSRECETSGCEWNSLRLPYRVPCWLPADLPRWKQSWISSEQAWQLRGHSVSPGDCHRGLREWGRNRYRLVACVMKCIHKSVTGNDLKSDNLRIVSCHSESNNLCSWFVLRVYSMLTVLINNGAKVLNEKSAIVCVCCTENFNTFTDKRTL